MKNQHMFNLFLILSILVIQSTCCDNFANMDLTKQNWGLDVPLPPFFQTRTILPPTSLATAKESETNTPYPTSTVIPSNTVNASPTTTQTLIPTDTITPVCLQPLSPAESTTFGSTGKISFSWASNIEAASYMIVITAPNGTKMSFKATDTDHYSRYLESFAWGGEYAWQVVALDADGKELCRSIPLAFTKPVTEPTLTAVPRPVKENPPGYIPLI